MNLIDLDTFVRVAELGTISAAAKAMGIPKSTVSRRVARLEHSLGVALLQRAGRRYALTDRGRFVRDRCGPALREITDVERALGDLDEDPAGLLRLTVPYDLGAAPGFATFLAAFRERHPRVQVEVELTNRMVDLIEEGYDIAIRPSILVGSEGLVARAVGGAIRIGWYASAAYLARRGTPRTVADLAEHECIVHEVMRHQPTMLEGATELFERAATVCSDFGLVHNMAVAGAGIGALPSFVARTALESGRIVLVLPEVQGAPFKLWLAWPETRSASPRVRAFIDFAKRSLAEHVF